jgi:hypothetical protein
MVNTQNKWVSILRLREALQSLATWRSQNDSQGCMHLVHFLASKRCNVRKSQWQKYSEHDDREFCDRFLRVRPGEDPYYDPLNETFRLDSHGHSNIATARKKTFADKWKAGQYKEMPDGEYWRFSDDYVDSLASHMGRKSGFVPIPALDLVAWLYRDQVFEETATCKTILDRFKADFHLTAEERTRLFFVPKQLDAALDRRFFSYAAFDPDLTLRLVTSPDTFDLADSIEASAQARKAPAMNAKDLATFIRDGKRRQIILQGPPGTGKTFLAKHTVAHLLGVDAHALPELHVDLVDDQNRGVRVKTFRDNGKRGWSLLQFHPAYGYEEFVRGIAPTVKGETSGFEVRDRAFVLACELAKNASADHPFVMVLDEINRADLAKTFGELIYGLEYREEPVTLGYAKDGSASLRVPSNLVIIGTMNTTDRSIAHMDYAIRRRFDFIDVRPDRSVIDRALEGRDTRAAALMLFDAFSALLQERPDHLLGQSYFMHETPETLAQAIVFQAMPLLNDYRREGLIEDSVSLALPGWAGDGLRVGHGHPFELTTMLTQWIREQQADDATAN